MTFAAQLAVAKNTKTLLIDVFFFLNHYVIVLNKEQQTFADNGFEEFEAFIAQSPNLKSIRFSCTGVVRFIKCVAQSTSVGSVTLQTWLQDKGESSREICKALLSLTCKKIHLYVHMFFTQFC